MTRGKSGVSSPSVTHPIMLVQDRMTKQPITAQPGTKVDEASALMKRHGIHRLPVLDKGKLVGIITDADLMRVAPSAATTLSHYEIHSLLAQITVREVMQKSVIS